MVRARCIAVVIASLLLPISAQGQPGDDGAYRALIDEAVSEFRAERWAEARALFARAHELSPNARTLRGIGMASYEMRRYVDALKAFQAALGEQRLPLTDEQRTEVETFVTNARRFVGVYRLQGDAPHALALDGRAIQPPENGVLMLDVGPHTLVATRDDAEPWRVSLDVRGGEDRTLDIELREAPPRERALEPPSVDSPAAVTSVSVPARDTSVAAPASDRGSNAVGLVLVTTGAVLVAGGVAGAIWWADRNAEVGACEMAAACVNRDDVEASRDVAAGVTIAAFAAGAVLGGIGLFVLVDDESGSGGAASACRFTPFGGECRVRF